MKLFNIFRRKPTIKVPAPEIIKTIQMANALRTAMGEDTITDLPNGRKRDGKECIVAKAFNFNCTVARSLSGEWYVLFPADEMTTEQVKKIREWAVEMLLEPYYHLSFYLPQEIGRIAWRFDAGQLSEYDEERDAA